MKLIAGNSNPNLAEKVASKLGETIVDTNITTFSDGEINIEINENVRGEDVFVFQSTSHPVNNNIIELCLIADALKRASAKRITAVMPYFGYSRQDKKAESRVPISAKAIANMLEAVGVDRVLSVDLHSSQIQGFFNLPVDNLFASKIFLDYIKGKFYLPDLTIVSPDAGGVNRAHAYSKRLDCGLAIFSKVREKANQIADMKLIGDVKDKDCIIVDDMIDTGGTMCKASNILKNNGARSVGIFATHAILSGDALSRFATANIKKVNITDTISLSNEYMNKGMLKQHSIAHLIAEAVMCIHNEKSVAALFD